MTQTWTLVKLISSLLTASAGEECFCNDGADFSFAASIGLTPWFGFPIPVGIRVQIIYETDFKLLQPLRMFQTSKNCVGGGGSKLHNVTL